MVAMLDKPGLLLTFLLAAIIFATGGLQFLALIFVFLVLAVFATRFGYYEKKEMGIYEHDRSWENVLSNGLVPAIVSVAGFFLGWGAIPYICSIAAVTADKFASELGVLGGDPVSLDGFRRVKPGTSGAVSPTGTIMSLVGAAGIGIVSILLFGITPTVALMITFAGFAGSFADTLFGVLEEKGFGTKGTTNLLCAVTGAAIGFLIR